MELCLNIEWLCILEFGQMEPDILFSVLISLVDVSTKLCVGR
jgi:hypothetical protein